MTTEPNIGTQVAIKFLRNYHEFGSRAHLVTARLLTREIEATLDPEERKLLAVKVFSEFMASLEDLGAISIAIRHRDEGVGLVYSYLTYSLRSEKLSPPTTLPRIFELLASGDGLVNGLRLPLLTEILKALPAFEGTLIPTMYREANIALAQAAAVYLAQDKALVRAYNKTKHGFVVVSDQHCFQPDPPKTETESSWIVAKNPDYDPSHPAGIPVVELFAVRLKDVRNTLDRMPVIRGALMFITELTAVLLELNLITSADTKA